MRLHVRLQLTLKYLVLLLLLLLLLLGVEALLRLLRPHRLSHEHHFGLLLVLHLSLPETHASESGGK